MPFRHEGHEKEVEAQEKKIIFTAKATYVAPVDMQVFGVFSVNLFLLF